MQEVIEGSQNDYWVYIRTQSNKIYIELKGETYKRLTREKRLPTKKNKKKKIDTHIHMYKIWSRKNRMTVDVRIEKR